MRGLNVEKAQEVHKQSELTQARDLAGEAYTTLARKQTEVTISSSIKGSEVRFASPSAVPDTRSISRALLLLAAAIVGLVFGVVVAALVQVFRPIRVPQGILGHPAMPWNRAYTWAMTPSSGLPSKIRPIEDTGSTRPA